MARNRSTSRTGRRQRRRVAGSAGWGRGRLPSALLALLISFGAVLTTVGIAAHNLGARPGLRFVNGGKIFLPQGAMWYHLPGLGDLDLAPQNIGGQGNLRNNDVALLDWQPARLDRVELDLGLAQGAYALLILEQSGEGTLTALRLSAMADPGSPFDNALVRYVDGVLVQHQPLVSLGSTVSAGRHLLVLQRGASGACDLSLDNQKVALDLDLDEIQPALALGSGELDLRLHRWRVEGLDRAGQPRAYEQGWSRGETLRHWGRTLLTASAGLWLLLVGLPLLWVASLSRQAPDRLLVAILLRPRAHIFYALVCLLPFTPLVLQLALLANHLLLVAWGLMRQLDLYPPRAEDDENRVSAPIPRWKPLALALGLMALGAAALGLSVALRLAPLGGPMPANDGPRLAQLDGAGPLKLGEGRRLLLPTQADGALRFTGSLTLAADEVLRLDLLQALPDEADLFQVDRASVYSAAAVDPATAAALDRAPRSFQGLSLVLSARPGLPSELLVLDGFSVERSAQAWTLAPGPHAIEISVVLPVVTVAVDGEIREQRDDLGQVFGAGRPASGAAAPGPKALLVQAWSEQVSALGPLTVDQELAGAPGQAARRWAALPAALGVLLVLMGWATLLLTRRPGATVSSLGGLAREAARPQLYVGAALLAYLLGALWPGSGPSILQQRGLLLTAVVLSALQLSRRLRARAWGGAAVALALSTQLLVGVEATSWVWPQWRAGITRYWNHGLAADQRWAYDPMLRRLNPWYVDMRFLRRPWTLERPEGRGRVVVFGGSQTYGWGIPSRDRQTFSDRLQQELRDRGHDIEVINAAFPGGKTETGLRWFEGNLSRYQPDIIVLNYLVNEFMDVDTYGVWAGKHGPDATVAPLAALAWILRLPADVRTRHIVQIVLAHRYDKGDLDGNLRRWVAAAQARGVKVLLSVEPTNLYVETAGAEIMRNDPDAGEAPRITRQVGAALGVPVYDPLPELLAHPTDLYFFDTMHLSRHGHAVMGAGLAELLSTELLSTELLSTELLPPVAP